MVKLICKQCNKTFYERPYRKNIARYCSYKCYWLSKVGIKHSKEHNRKISISIRKNLPKTIFKKGFTPWNKGTHIQSNTGRTHFKKGLKPWNKNTKGMMPIPWNKNKPHMQGSNHPNWNNGKTIRDGYMYIYFPHHPFATKQKYVLRSRLVAEKHLKRFLKPAEIIHHINCNTLDDRPQNLYLFSTHSKHMIFHSHSYQLKSNII